MGSFDVIFSPETHPIGLRAHTAAPTALTHFRDGLRVPELILFIHGLFRGFRRLLLEAERLHRHPDILDGNRATGVELRAISNVLTDLIVFAVLLHAVGVLRRRLLLFLPPVSLRTVTSCGKVRLGALFVAVFIDFGPF